MGIHQLDAYVLVLSGMDRMKFLDGLSTNKVDQSCTTVLTTTQAKIIDVVDVIEVGENLAVVGHGPYKEDVLRHLQPRILQQRVNIRDISSLNSVYVSTEPFPETEGLTISKSFLGWLVVAPNSISVQSTLTRQEFDDYRIQNMIPFQQSEITREFHPFNCGLSEFVHEAKGCYIGQEILTRMRSRGKMGKQLMKVDKNAEDATTIGTEFSLAIRRT
jgi:folate-binding protein YgfZ